MVDRGQQFAERRAGIALKIGHYGHLALPGDPHGAERPLHAVVID
jgi:hypothetical protein